MTLWTLKARFYGDGDGAGRVAFRRLSALSGFVVNILGYRGVPEACHTQ